MSIDLYPPIIHEGDLSPDSFGNEVDQVCQEIHAACKGFGTDEDRLLKAMGSMSPETRYKVALRYKELFGKELVKVMESECGNRNFGFALQLLAVDPVQTECLLIDKACKGAGTDEDLLFSIICGRTNTEIELLKKKYFAWKTEDLGRRLDSELGGNLESLIFNVFQAAEEKYDPDYHNDAKIKADVEQLYSFGTGKWGTNEKGIFKILCAAPPQYLKALNLAYAEKHGYTLPKVLEKELGGHVQRAAMYMVDMKLKPYEAAAKLIDKACRGMGTNELLLSATIIRNQGVLKEVMVAHEELFSKNLRDRIRSEVGGDYSRLLLQIIDSAE
ncbi:hypothetical protein FisN_16Hh169 [Fistulifera solaris]|uniref:Annexin n=1 Tax=Fistulifera solaris TaxID=1519565 RepID=A0A1Z5KTP2_FISSO|nr:hypothetical protein FisN_16Hh169 [Fistulifera solaris]|eukprot:GAX29391.1 hypothetical protein FisN_16Hh169 [Fistulifera solaris]